jgi:hypothetical protein
MTGELRMADSITAANLPSGYDAYLGYRDGRWPDFAAEVAKFPGAHVLDMAVTAADDATGLDVEKFDATVAQAPGWTWRQRGRGLWRPVLYASASNMGALWAALEHAGIARSSVRLLSAHYTYEPHICGPATCAFPGVPACDGSQWTDRAPGLHGSLIDESLLVAGFFGAPPVPSPPAHPPLRTDQEDAAMILGRKGTPTPIALTDAETQIRFCPVFGAAGPFPVAELSVNFHQGGEHPVTVDAAPDALLPVLPVPPGVRGITVFRLDDGDHDVSAVVF